MLGWRQKDLAKRAGVSHMTIKFIEQGRSIPRVDTMEKIETAFRKEGIEFGLRMVRHREV